VKVIGHFLLNSSDNLEELDIFRIVNFFEENNDIEKANLLMA
jgi:hypothetical protein